VSKAKEIAKEGIVKNLCSI